MIAAFQGVQSIEEHHEALLVEQEHIVDEKVYTYG